MDRAIGVLDAKKDVFVQDLFEFLRFKTISAQSAHASDVRTCAEWVRGQLDAAGLSTELLETPGHPAVFADSGPRDDSALTLLFYGHYDVQPAGDERLWRSPPFEPTVHDGAIVARGSSDDKGQVMTHLTAMRCLHESNTPLPVRVKFLIEGEEEIGSPNLPALVEQYRERLACDYVVLSDTSKHDDDTPALPYSTRGMVYKEIVVQGPSRDLHSGHFGGTVANPANTLAKIIAALHDDNGRVTIPGFYDDVLPLSDDERQTLAAHGRTDQQLLAETGSPSPWGEAGYTNTERHGARPTLDVNGISGGYTGQGASTIVPAKASAKISMRLVARQDGQKIARAFDEAVRAACPATVTLTIQNHAACDPYVGAMDSPGIRAAIEALETAYGRAPILTREGGTLPILPMFQKVLGADSLLMGFAAPNCLLHSPNEFFHLRDFELGVRCILRFLDIISKKST